MAERGCSGAARGGRAGAGGRAAARAAPEEPPEEPPERRGCRYLRSGRACCRMLEVLLAALLLVCSSVSGGPAGGYTALPALGGLYYYHYGGAYSGFSAAEGERAQQLDRRFHLLKLPIARAAMAVGGCLLVLPCILLLVGVLRVPWHFPAWLLIESTLGVATAVGAVPALYYFFHSLLGVYNSSVCKEREQLYQSKGYQGFQCSLHGAEVAVGLLGCMAIVAYLFSAVLAVRGYRTLQQQKDRTVIRALK